MKIKIILFGIITIFITTWLVASYTYEAGVHVNPHQWWVMPNIVDFDNFSIDTITYLISTYFKLVTFTISDIPFFITLIFTIINFITFYIIIQDLLLPLLRSNPWVLLVSLIGVALSAFIAWVSSFNINIGDIFGDVAGGVSDIWGAVSGWFNWGWF